ncbi:MAG: hypothetical protein R3F17_08425 [Planctomycetota bacterium]
MSSPPKVRATTPAACARLCSRGTPPSSAICPWRRTRDAYAIWISEAML